MEINRFGVVSRVIRYSNNLESVRHEGQGFVSRRSVSPIRFGYGVLVRLQ